MTTKIGPWTRLTTKEIFKNTWIHLIEDEVLNPRGQKTKYAKLRMLDGISVLPIDDEGNVYLAKEYRYPIEKESLEVVSGGIEQGEEPLQTAKRELQEELGIQAQEWIPLGHTQPYTGTINSTAHLFLAKKLTFGKTNQEAAEVIQMVKMPIKDAKKKAMNSEIFHAQSCLCVLKACEYLGIK